MYAKRSKCDFPLVEETLEIQTLNKLKQITPALLNVNIFIIKLLKDVKLMIKPNQ
jgi:hypothetical protein